MKLKPDIDSGASPDPPPHAELRPSRRVPEREDHDVLIFPNPGIVGTAECYRIPVVKEDQPAHDRRRGEFVLPPERWDLRAFGQRRALSIARPHHADGGEPRGPAFAVLPIKPEPASVSAGTCYLINAENFTSPNLWTVEEWNDDPLGEDYLTPQHPEAFEVLIAAPWGKVFHLKIAHHERWPSGPLQIEYKAGGSAATGHAGGDDPAGGAAASGGHDASGTHTLGQIECVDLSRETEVWSQLRNGCVAGRVWFRADGGRVVPLVNVTALQPQKIKHVPKEAKP
jgi:hypothetical protein